MLKFLIFSEFLRHLYTIHTNIRICSYCTWQGTHASLAPGGMYNYHLDYAREQKTFWYKSKDIIPMKITGDYGYISNKKWPLNKVGIPHSDLLNLDDDKYFIQDMSLHLLRMQQVILECSGKVSIRYKVNIYRLVLSEMSSIILWMFQLGNFHLEKKRHWCH